MPVRDALPVLTRARAGPKPPRSRVLGAAGVLALQLAARGLLLPGLSATDHDAWRAGPLTPDDLGRIQNLRRPCRRPLTRYRSTPLRNPCCWPNPSGCCGRSWMPSPTDCRARPPRHSPPRPRVRRQDTAATARSAGMGGRCGGRARRRVRLSLRIEVLGSPGRRAA
ncbi:hypothetical protein NKH18_50680 [Streptomyces sp. M10(2022)]